MKKVIAASTLDKLNAMDDKQIEYFIDDQLRSINQSANYAIFNQKSLEDYTETAEEIASHLHKLEDALHVLHLRRNSEGG